MVIKCVGWLMVDLDTYWEPSGDTGQTGQTSQTSDCWIR